MLIFSASFYVVVSRSPILALPLRTSFKSACTLTHIYKMEMKKKQFHFSTYCECSQFQHASIVHCEVSTDRKGTGQAYTHQNTFGSLNAFSSLSRSFLSSLKVLLDSSSSRVPRARRSLPAVVIPTLVLWRRSRLRWTKCPCQSNALPCIGPTTQCARCESQGRIGSQLR